MRFRKMLVLGIIPTCILCERAFLATPEFPFACGPCCTGKVSLDDMTRAFLAGARKFASVQSVSEFWKGKS